MVIALTILAVACGDPPATPSVAVSTPTPSEMAESRRFREQFGLRTDDLWISKVAGDPASQEGLELFGVPLLPSELSELTARTMAYMDAGPIILDYAATVPDDWYGSFIDQQRGGIIVATFFRNTDRHREALARLLPPSARWEVRQVDQRTLDMIAFVARVKADRAWFTTIDAELLDVVTNPMDGGVVELTYIAASRALDPVILDHYGTPDWLRVERAGGPPWTGPVGDLVVKAIGPGGKPVAGLICHLSGGDNALVTDRDGVCRYPAIPAVSYRVELWAGVEESTHVAGLATVSVQANELTTVAIVAQVP